MGYISRGFRGKRASEREDGAPASRLRSTFKPDDDPAEAGDT